MIKFLGLGSKEFSLDDLILELEVDFNLYLFQGLTEAEGRGREFRDWDDL